MDNGRVSVEKLSEVKSCEVSSAWFQGSWVRHRPANDDHALGLGTVATQVFCECKVEAGGFGLRSRERMKAWRFPTLLTRVN